MKDTNFGNCSALHFTHGEHGKEPVFFRVLRVLLSVAETTIADRQNG
jgi:hypothetical protein